MSWLSRIANAFRPSRVDRALDEEISFHIESRIDDLVAGGMTRDQATATARRQFGNRLRLRESSRDVKLMQSLEDVVRDVRHGLRTFRRAPMFAAVAMLTIALGIGANTAIFSIVNGVLLRPLAYPRPAQLVYLTTMMNRTPLPVSVPEYLEFQQFNRSFMRVGAFRTGEANLVAGDRALRVRSAIVDEPLLNALGLEAAEGRLFTREDSVVSAPPLPGGSAVTMPVVLISHQLWQSAFGGQPVVGHNVDIDGRRFEVVGVMARGADLMDTQPEIWLPLGFADAERTARNNHNLLLIGRLKEGVTLASAETELDALLETWSARAGGAGPGHAGHVFLPLTKGGEAHALVMTPLAAQILGRAGRAIWMLQVAVGFVLIIACANVANLLFARAEIRQREFAVLTALGAGRGRLLRKAVIESVILSVGGGAIGMLLARAGVEALVRAYPSSLPRISEVTVDARAMVVSLGVAIACGLVFGLAPMMMTWRGRSDVMVKTLKTGLRAGGTTRQGIRRALVIAETALAVLVVVGAGLLLRTVHNLTAVDAGFDRSRLVTFSITLPRTGYDYLARVRAFQRLVDEVRAVPGVQAASGMTGLPLDRQFLGNQTEITGSTGSPVPSISIEYQRVMSGFFDTMGIPILHGRGFDASDAAAGGVVVVNETLANTYWKGRDPIGQQLRPATTRPWFTVIGVAKDIKQTGVDQPVGAEAYVLVDQLTAPPQSWVAISPTTLHVVVRTTVPPSTLAATLAQGVRRVDPAIPIARLREMEEVFAESIRRPRLLAQLLTVFSLLALLLAAIGTYGVLASMVAERRRELGIRLALGANRARLLRHVITQGLMLTAAGVVVGLACALALNRLLTSLLYGVRPTDVATFAAAMSAMLGIAALASWLPAWRASRLDPNVVLRLE